MALRVNMLMGIVIGLWLGDIVPILKIFN